MIGLKIVEYPKWRDNLFIAINILTGDQSEKELKA